MGLSTVIMASAATAWPVPLRLWNSEIFSLNGQPACTTPNGDFLYAALPSNGAASLATFSLSPVEQESLPCLWHRMQ